MEYRHNKDLSASHLPILIRVIEASQGDMMEIGTGYYSTPIFHLMAQMTERHCYSYENNPEWYEKAKKYESEYHHIILIDDWNKLPSGKRWGIVFVDQSPSQSRRVAIAKYANSADYIVAHDSEIDRQPLYHLERTLLTFKYRFDYKKLVPNTSVVSNFYDLKFLEKP